LRQMSYATQIAWLVFAPQLLNVPLFWLLVATLGIDNQAAFWWALPFAVTTTVTLAALARRGGKLWDGWNIEAAARALRDKCRRANIWLTVAGAVTAFAAFCLTLVTATSAANLVLRVAVGLGCATCILFWNRWHLLCIEFFSKARLHGVTSGMAEDALDRARSMAASDRVRRFEPFVERNFCSVVQATCEKHLLQQGVRSIFLAHPFSPRSTTDEMRSLAVSLRRHDCVVTPPPGDDTAELLVCKVCRAIRENEYFIGHVSAPNQNVYLEYGIAKGLGKISWLVVPQGSLHNPTLSHFLLRDTIQLRPQSEDNAELERIVEHFTWSIVSKIGRSPTNGEDAPRTAERQVFAEPRTLLVLSPSVVGFAADCSGTIHAEVLSVLASAAHSRGLQLDEPASQAFGHASDDLYRRICGSTLFVALLADESKDSSLAANALTCYTIGFALARGVPTLVLQHGVTRNRVMDIHGMVRLYSTPDGARQLVATALDRVMADSYGMQIVPPPDAGPLPVSQS